MDNKQLWHRYRSPKFSKLELTEIFEEISMVTGRKYKISDHYALPSMQF